MICELEELIAIVKPKIIHASGYTFGWCIQSMHRTYLVVDTLCWGRLINDKAFGWVRPTDHINASDKAISDKKSNDAFG